MLNVLIKLCYIRMTSNPRICYLLHIETAKRIYLAHNELKVIGRSIETEIQDLHVSKRQFELLADTHNCSVKLRPIGKAISGIDGYATVKDKTYNLGHGHRIELRLGYHAYEIVFDPSDKVEEEHSQVSKRPKMSFPIFNLKNEETSTKDDFIVSGKWEDIDGKQLLIYTPENIEAKSKIAAFDIDGTIITTKSGARFPKDGDDWKLLYNSISLRLKQLFEDGFKIVFFTNQSGIGGDAYKIKDFKRKIENIIKKLALPIQVFVATGKTIHRKPAPGMWNVLTSKKNDVDIDIKESFYVGDAAGRDKNLSRKYKDHSCADRLFALNIGLQFFTPEEFFLDSKAEKFNMPEFDPKNLSNYKYLDMNYDSPNVILMVGAPGSGKSHFCRKFLNSKGYIHINRDSLGSWQKCVKSLEQALKEKQSCVIDNTNVDRESRARFVEVARRFNVDCRCFVMSTDIVHSKHNNRFRELTDKTHVPVSDIIINSLQKNYKDPEESEGFKEIVKIPFVPFFENVEHEKLYKMFLLEK